MNDYGINIKFQNNCMNNIFKQNYQTKRIDRNRLNNHNSFLIWFTGLSGSGKSTIANALEQKLFSNGINTYTLDGDNIRKGINSDLSFSKEDRTENIRRISEISKLFIDAGLVVLSAFVSPYRKDRKDIKNIVESSNFVEIYINTSLEECESRDVKGLYKKARLGEIGNFTGISAPYEEPINPDIVINTEEMSVDLAVDTIYNYIKNKL